MSSARRKRLRHFAIKTMNALKPEGFRAFPTSVKAGLPLLR
jgi:hypothetical protein